MTTTTSVTFILVLILTVLCTSIVSGYTRDIFQHSLQFWSSNKAMVTISKGSDLLSTRSYYTIEMWINPKSYSLNNSVLLSTKDGFPLVKLEDRKLLCIDLSGAQVASSVDIFAEEWTHIACTRHENRLTALVNAQSRDVNIGLNQKVTKKHIDLVIGAFTDNSLTYNNAFSGQIDELRIYRKAKNANQLAKSKDSIVDPSDDSLIAYYRFDEVGEHVTDIQTVLGVQTHGFLGKTTRQERSDPHRIRHEF
jgi:hypothetical protein